MIHILNEAWMVLGQMAPYLLFGFLMAGVLSVLISPVWVERHLGKRGIRQVGLAALMGVPLPLCSCGVIPVSASLRRHGAGKGATVSFLASTPQTGVDSIMATYALLGPVLTIFRMITAFVSGLMSGVLTEWFDKDKANKPTPEKTGHAQVQKSTGQHFRRIMYYGFVELPADIGKAVLIGVLISGLLAAVIPDNFFADKLGNGFLSMIMMMLIGIPIYVCSTGSIPLGFAMLHMGISPGAVLVFLVTGPATNAAAFTTIWKVLGRRTAVIYVLTIAACGLTAGMLLNQMLDGAGMTTARHTMHIESAWWHQASALLLLAVLLNAICRPLFTRKQAAFQADAPTAVWEINGMNCSKCVKTVTRALEAQPGIQRVEIDLSSGECRIHSDCFNAAQAKTEIEGLGYNVHDASEGKP
jgi:hypothetical protein